MPRRLRKLESTTQAIASKDWDHSIRSGDFVCLMAEGPTPHVYEIREFISRVIIEHELFNNPHLLARGLKPGDELPPLLVVRRVREAPSYNQQPPRRTIERRVDADKVIKVTLDYLQGLVDNLQNLAATIRERSQNDDSIREG